ncbi:hypothetical protein N9233_00750 [Flavobacteriales bacterium]|nr:hypothetical protein [Flavobacteriales bacterium]
MKAFFTGIFTCFLLLEISAQEAIVYPYNPDADNDEIVGVTDLLPLLSVFGEDFQPGEILVDGVALAEVLMTMQQTIETLQLQVETLEAQAMPELASHLSFVDSSSTFHLEAANLQVSNGGSAYLNNGLGNLIIGMNGEEEYVDSVGRGGSHNLVIGEGHAYSNSHGILHGFNATLTDRYAAVIGGSNNRVDGAYGVAIAGTNNVVLDDAHFAAAIGGQGNSLNADYAAAIAGSANEINGRWSAGVSGIQNKLIGTYTLAAGGRGGEISGSESVIVGSSGSSLEGHQAVIVGGEGHLLGSDSTDARFSVILGGRFANLNSGYCGVISGGINNMLTTDSLWQGAQARSIFGGKDNDNRGYYGATVVGGNGNEIFQRPGEQGGADLSIGVNAFIGTIQTDNTQNIRVTGELEEE